MIRSFLIVFAVIIGFSATAQQRTSSPYSFFGLGQQTFKGTVENRAMGSIRTYSDSIHVNLRNPASYGNLRLTTYAVGATHTQTIATDGTLDDSFSNTTIEYVSIGIPLSKKAAFGFGLVPFQSVGYRIGGIEDNIYTNFEGRGGLNRAYFSLGTNIVDGLSIGAEVRYNFGEENNSSSVVLDGVQFGTNETNDADFSGVSWNLGLHYSKLLTESREIQFAATYSPESDITATGNRTISNVSLIGDSELLSNTQILDESRNKFKLPSELTLGIGYGQRLKWFLGAEYTQRGSSVTTNRSFSPAATEFNDATSYRVGGYFIPDYNSITSYWKRITYRAGFRYDETGLNLNGQDITEFGMSFGMSIPVGQTSAFSNANFSFEYGQRGTTTNGLIKEDFFSVSLGLSLNDKWFQKLKYR